MTLLAAKAAGATPLIITDLSKGRLDFAKKICPQAITVQIDTSLDAKGQAQKIKEAAGMPLSLALECTGVESSITTAAYVRLLILYSSRLHTHIGTNMSSRVSNSAALSLSSELGSR